MDMNLLISIAYLVGGFILLLKAADFFVDGASALAKKLAISEIVIGLTVVAFGTSAPELVVNVVASIKQDAPGISFGNIVGSNICNILLILGLAGLIHPIRCTMNTVAKEIPFAIFSALLLLLLCNDQLWGSQFNHLSFGDGVIFLVFFCFFLYYVLSIAKTSAVDTVELSEVKAMSGQRISIYLVLGLLGMVIGGKFVVDHAVLIATRCGVSQKLIGLTIVAIGTSLPELATSVVASYKGRNAIAMGNIVGSNIFNIFFVLGASLCISPIVFGTPNPSNFALDMTSANIDLGILVVASVLLLITMFTGKKSVLDRWEAGVFLTVYVGYIAYLMVQK